MYSGKTSYLLVYGGLNVAGVHLTVLMLDMDRRSRGWFSIPGIQFDKQISIIVNGGLVKQLAPRKKERKNSEFCKMPFF
jgi:hypothetical protein